MVDEILEIYAWYHPDAPKDYFGHVQHFQDLALQLRDVTPLLDALVCDMGDGRDAVALNDPELPEVYADWYEKHRAAYPDDEDVKLVTGSKPFLGPDGEEITNTSIRYIFGAGPNGKPDNVKIKIPLVFADSPGMAQVVTNLVRVLTKWRPAQAVVAFPSMLKMSGKVFFDYHSSGFGIWLTKPLDGIDLSDAHSVTRINDGTLILTAPEMFNLADAEAIRRYQAIDGHLVQADVMPKLSEGPILF